MRISFAASHKIYSVILLGGGRRRSGTVADDRIDSVVWLDMIDEIKKA
jgi:hypothetical protein